MGTCVTGPFQLSDVVSYMAACSGRTGPFYKNRWFYTNYGPLRKCNSAAYLWISCRSYQHKSRLLGFDALLYLPCVLCISRIPCKKLVVSQKELVVSVRLINWLLIEPIGNFQHKSTVLLRHGFGKVIVGINDKEIRYWFITPLKPCVNVKVICLLIILQICCEE